MRISINHIAALAFTISIFCIIACSKEKDEVQSGIQDVDETAALKNVTITYDSMNYVLGLPEGALSGASFDSLRHSADSAKYLNPANYNVTLLANMKANNTKSDAKDAKFEGMTINTVMDTIISAPVSTSAGAFTVNKGAVLPVIAQGSLNLLTHRLVGLYMFKQIVDGNDLATTLSPKLNYKIGSTAGSLPFPDIKTYVPTRADDKTKAFLQGLLDSKVFDKP